MRSPSFKVVIRVAGVRSSSSSRVVNFIRLCHSSAMGSSLSRMSIRLFVEICPQYIRASLCAYRQFVVVQPQWQTVTLRGLRIAPASIRIIIYAVHFNRRVEVKLRKIVDDQTLAATTWWLWFTILYSHLSFRCFIRQENKVVRSNGLNLHSVNCSIPLPRTVLWSFRPDIEIRVLRAMSINRVEAVCGQIKNALLELERIEGRLASGNVKWQDAPSLLD